MCLLNVKRKVKVFVENVYMSKKINLLLLIIISILFVLILLLCNNEDDIFNLKINLDVKVSDIFYKIFLL